MMDLEKEQIERDRLAALPLSKLIIELADVHIGDGDDLGVLARALHERIDRLAYTAEQPTKAGWYWFKGWRIDDQRDERHDIELDVVRVFGPASCDGYHGEWAGPLEMPI